ncbi:hypothetical protein EJV46_04570 [Roseococcus sp. SYP-B2431]|uniref:hypothetical protein n=1 Tax=Roseococcus sp. SYP-B2431 TaxID=2496640 RepID=UPI0010390CCA|nr:hypothetical protein [Roseococcus sp. SYP-B2431]TCH99939.1 hypothetical protein EJV46_04570 [Roseococcus sp. SYP-B2431]
MPARLSLAVLLLATTSLSAAELPVRGVTLSSAGLAQIERSGAVPASEPALTFRVPTEDVDDILRSLVVSDPAGRVEGLRLPAQDLAAEAFRGLPVRPEDFESRAALLNALRGERIAIGGVEGRIAEATEARGGLRVSLITGTGLRSLRFTEEEELHLLDPGLAARIARAAEAVAATRAADTRQLSIALRPGANAEREIALAYVAGAPLWKPSWRLAVPEFGASDGRARLMGWAVVENRSGADWNGIRLSLASGEAAAFRQALYTPIILPRRELPIQGSGQVEIGADSGARPVPPPAPPAPVAASAPMARMAPRGGTAELAMPAPAPAFAEAPPPAAEASAAASLGRVAFTLADPVTIRAGETANLPFLDQRLNAERVWWAQTLAARYPLQAVRLRNDTNHALPGGIVTVFGSTGAEAGGFLGDTQLLGLPPGETRLLAFARDREVQYSVAQRSEATPIRVELRRGAVLAILRAVHTVAFAIDPRGGRGRFVADLPRRPGETPRFVPAAEGDFGLRVEAMLEGRPANLDWSWEREQQQTIPLWEAALPDPLPPVWRDLNLERDPARLPGGTDRLDALRHILARLPEGAPGRADLAALIADYSQARQLMDAFRTAARAYAAAEANLARARRAFEDRTGSEKENARQQLNAASVEAGRLGTAGDNAWTAWRAAAQKVVARGT